MGDSPRQTVIYVFRSPLPLLPSLRKVRVSAEEDGGVTVIFGNGDVPLSSTQWETVFVSLGPSGEWVVLSSGDVQVSFGDPPGSEEGRDPISPEEWIAAYVKKVRHLELPRKKSVSSLAPISITPP